MASHGWILVLIVCVGLMYTCSAQNEVCTTGPCNLSCSPQQNTTCTQNCTATPCKLDCKVSKICNQHCTSGNCETNCETETCVSYCYQGGCSNMNCKSKECRMRIGPNSVATCDNPIECNSIINGAGGMLRCKSKKCIVSCQKGPCTVTVSDPSKANVQRTYKCTASKGKCELACTSGISSCQHQCNNSADKCTYSKGSHIVVSYFSVTTISALVVMMVSMM